MKIIQVKQGTPEWNALRAGKPTASEFDRLVTTKGEPSKQREKYLYQLAGERVAGKKEETYQNGAMLRGKEMEAEARDCIRMITDYDVQEVGFCLADNGLYGASPDGLIGDDGGLELKCPMMATQVSYLLSKNPEREYYQQIQGNMLVTGRKWWMFVSYFPGLRPLIVKVGRDEPFLKALEAELEKFCAELEEVVNKIK